MAACREGCIIVTNYFGIPDHIESELRKRDSKCVYCGKEMKANVRVKGTSRDKATIEHLSFDGPFYWKDNLQKEDVVICCGSCNSSRGAKRLVEWFNSDYCRKYRINANTVAAPVKYYLKRYPSK
jgi:hypothetical protein